MSTSPVPAVASRASPRGRQERGAVGAATIVVGPSGAPPPRAARRARGRPRCGRGRRRRRRGGRARRRGGQHGGVVLARTGRRRPAAGAVSASRVGQGGEPRSTTRASRSGSSARGLAVAAQAEPDRRARIRSASVQHPVAPALGGQRRPRPPRWVARDRRRRPGCSAGRSRHRRAARPRGQVGRAGHPRRAGDHPRPPATCGSRGRCRQPAGDVDRLDDVGAADEVSRPMSATVTSPARLGSRREEEPGLEGGEGDGAGRRERCPAARP